MTAAANTPVRFAVIGLAHGHITAMARGLLDAGGILVAVHDEDPEALAAFSTSFPEAAVRSEDAILGDSGITLILSASVPDLRGDLACGAMRAGKDFFSAKPPFTSLDQLAESRRVATETGRRFFVFYCERLHVASALMAEKLIEEGRLGHVVQILCLAPHRLTPPARPDWFYDPKRSGGILCDIGSHQFEQILTYGGITAAEITHAAVGNWNTPQHPDFEDFGEATIIGNNGVSGTIRVDWLTPSGSSVWGDGRTFILGTKGTLEIRKYVDVAKDRSGDHLFLTDETGEHHLRPDPKAGFPYFARLLNDCQDRTETAMSQEHAFHAAELALRAQAAARRLRQAIANQAENRK